MLCQGPGGNTSFKKDGEIFIKKSGLHLSKSKIGTFQKINYESISNFYEKNINSDLKYNKNLSIETPLHVLSKAKYVFHYHSVASIVCSLIMDKKTLTHFLDEKEIKSISYVRPGFELAKEVQRINKGDGLKSFFLYNHGMLVEGENLQNIMKQILLIENYFAEIIDYPHLLKLKDSLYNVGQNGLLITNPDSSIQYEIFNDKFFFPDHAVFFPYTISQDKNSPIAYDQNNIIFNKKLTETELIYFRTLLIIFSYIKDKELFNYIDLKTSNALRNSDDEIYRKKLNK